MPRAFFLRAVLGALLAAVLFVAAVVTHAAPAGSSPENEHVAAATDFVQLLDAGEFADAYRGASTRLTTRTSLAAFITEQRTSRKGHGKTQCREAVEVHANAGPDAPAPEGLSVRFHTRFERADATELVELVRDVDGTYRTASYAVIGPFPLFNCTADAVADRTDAR